MVSGSHPFYEALLSVLYYSQSGIWSC